MKHVLPILSALLFAGCSAIPVPRTQIHSPAQLLFNGYVRAEIDCYACHGGNAGGTWKGPSLIDVGEELSHDQILRSIRKGPGIMPAYEDELTEPELDLLAAWLESLGSS